MLENSNNASLPAQTQLFAAAKTSSLVSVAVAMLPRVSAFSLANTLVLPRKEMSYEL
jgi:hypothetical protein